MSFDPDRIYHKLDEYGSAWAEKKMFSDGFEEKKKPFISQLKLNFEGSDANRNMRALASKEYMDFYKGLVQAAYETNLAKIRYDNTKTWVELLRTKASNDRAAMQLR